MVNLLEIRDITDTVTPEPSTLALLASGVGAMGVGLRGKRRGV
jgi:hypothetical protein